MLAALAGAVAFVVSNQDIPAIPIGAKIGPGQASLSVDLAGKTMDVLKSFDLALEKLEAGYKWKGGEVKGSYSQETSANAKTDKAMLKLALGQGYGSLFGSKSMIDGNETLRYGIEGGFAGDKLSIDSSLSQTLVPGLDPKTGNGKIAPALATLLKEAKQVVPPFLAGSGGGHAKEKASTDVRRPNAPERVVAPPVPAAGAPPPPHRDGGAGRAVPPGLLAGLCPSDRPLPADEAHRGGAGVRSGPNVISMLW